MTVDRVTTLVGIDPGPRTSGLVIYDLHGVRDGDGRVRFSDKAASWQTVERELRYLSASIRAGEVLVCCERVAPGRTGWSLVQTSEVIGRVLQLVDDIGREARLARPARLLTRREVLMALRVSGRGAERDKLVRHCLMEMHGGDRTQSIGVKADPGPLYGMASHAWAALAVVCAHRIIQREADEQSAAHRSTLPPGDSHVLLVHPF
ncbi:MAG: hypothetical protein L7S64_11470 [Longimicrobiales bacterium]|nr:hypothetical protein [Longimicrobiales bacterium]